MWGLTLDTLTSLDVVLANGTAVTASATQNKDLFWALRGAGPGFAVVTSFKLKTLAAPSVNINWSYTYTFNSAATAASAFQTAQNWGQQSAPKELGYGILVFPGGGVIVRGTYYGSKASFDAIIAPLLAKLKTINGGTAPTSSVKVLGWIDSLTDLAGSSLVTPVKGYDLHDTFVSPHRHHVCPIFVDEHKYAKSIDTKQSAPLSLSALQGLFNYIYNTSPPSGSSWMIIANLYGGPGSVINSFPASTDPSSTSSYAGRDSGYVWQLYAYTSNSQPPFVSAIIPFVENMVGALGAEAANLPAYAPYTDPELSQADAQTRYWRDGVARLKAIKSQVDPKGILYNPQGF
jgi:hypothetical protein